VPEEQICGICQAKTATNAEIGLKRRETRCERYFSVSPKNHSDSLIFELSVAGEQQNGYWGG
jgi:hypothetical protein